MKTLASHILLFRVFGGGSLCRCLIETGLLFYLSGDHQFVADYAAERSNPTFFAMFECLQTVRKAPALVQLRSCWLTRRREYLCRARFAGFHGALVIGGSYRIPNLSRRLRRSFKLGHGVVAHRL